jgi:hypothetical protein
VDAIAHLEAGTLKPASGETDFGLEHSFPEITVCFDPQCANGSRCLDVIDAHNCQVG